MVTENQEHELILWGATGFTGQLVAEHLAERYEPSELDWAIAGRNEEKLKSLRQDLFNSFPNLDSLPIFLGDAFDKDSLLELAEKTKAICTTVGPYALFGSNLVEACVETGTHYCDLTGEAQWMQKMIDRHHQRARENDTRIIHSCGFDSVPSDIGALMVQNYAEETFGSTCSSIKAYAKSSSLELSGGTLASMVQTFEDVSDDKEARRALQNPYSLAPDGEREGPGAGMQYSPGYDDSIKQWTAPFVMALTNEKIVWRTNALQDYPWGREFNYDESMPTGTGITGIGKATGISSLVALAMGAFAIGPIRSFLSNYVLPESGEGPDRETRENSSFTLRLIGEGTNPDTQESFEVEGTVRGDRDPGYGATAWMLGESAVCLAKDDTDTSLKGGVLTPATGIGLPLKDRLQDVGMTFSVDTRQ